MLEEIVRNCRRDLAQVKAERSLEKLLEEIPEPRPASLQAALLRPQINIIAEIKYASPSHGPFRCRLEPEPLARLYVEGGAAAISVLTESRYFSGRLDYLRRVHRQAPDTPVLRKDFIVDRYQIAEARLYGASAYLLIAACLSPGELVGLAGAGQEYGLDPLVEVHNAFELEQAIEAGARIIGVNNRDLRTFRTDIRTSFEIARRLEGVEGFLLVSESGLEDRSQIEELRDAGFSAFLIGTTFMDSDDPEAKLRELLGSE